MAYSFFLSQTKQHECALAEQDFKASLLIPWTKRLSSTPLLRHSCPDSTVCNHFWRTFHPLWIKIERMELYTSWPSLPFHPWHTSQPLASMPSHLTVPPNERHTLCLANQCLSQRLQWPQHSGACFLPEGVSEWSCSGFYGRCWHDTFHISGLLLQTDSLVLTATSPISLLLS